MGTPDRVAAALICDRRFCINITVTRAYSIQDPHEKSVKSQNYPGL